MTETLKYLLIIGLTIGLGLRLFNLDSLPPWTDECATLVFSLGNSFRTVPLNEVISGEILLQPLQPNPEASIHEVWQHLMSESTHPPVYFFLAHWWMRLFPPVKGLASIWAARLLPTLLGIASVPAVFGCCWWAFRSRSVAYLAAAMMAVSPFGVYLAQEARHYTLAVLFIVASLCCLVRAAQAIVGWETFPGWVALVWIVINSLGIAVHYFFSLTLCSEFLVLVGFGIMAARSHPDAFSKVPWMNLWVAVAGTVAGGLVWVPVWQGVYSSNLTDWVADGSPGTFEPWLRLSAWLIAMLTLPPSDLFVFPHWLVGIFGSLTIAFLLGAVPLLYRGLRRQMTQNVHYVTLADNRRVPILVFAGVVLASLVLILGLTYGLGKDLTLAPRFSFIYFPAVIVLIGCSLAAFKDESLRESHWSNCRIVNPIFIILLMAVLGSVIVANNLGYLQTHRSDRMASLIYETSEAPVLIAITHRHHGDTGRLMGLAWEFHQLKQFKPSWTLPPQFLLAHNDDNPNSINNPTRTLKQRVAQSLRPIDVWAVDFNAQIDLAGQKCDRDEAIKRQIGDYRYKLYHCFAS